MGSCLSSKERQALEIEDKLRMLLISITSNNNHLVILQKDVEYLFRHLASRNPMVQDEDL